MKKSLVTLTLVAAFALVGCGSTTATDKPANATAEQAKPAASTDIKAGLGTMVKTAKAVRKAVTANDEAKIKENGPKLEENWSAFEDGVKEKYPDLYAEIEKSLNPAIVATQASPLDKDMILKLDNQLIDSLYKLSEKVIPTEEVKSGTAKMITTTEDLKKAIADNNDAKIKELGPKLEETWATFEDGVKPRSSDMYEKIEKSLNPEVAGSQAATLDKNTLGTLNDQLNAALKEFQSKL
jgi:iron uptake system EfeUOB component EfeO/EfeM